MAYIGPLMGYRIYTNPQLTEVETYELERTVRERWFSLPFRPWVKLKTVSRTVPSKKLIVQNKVIVVHPAMLDQLKTALYMTKKQNPLFGIDGLPIGD